METALISIALVIGLWAGVRMFRRAFATVWARFVSSVFAQDAWAWIVSWGQAPEDVAPSPASDAPSSDVPSLAQDGPASTIRDATPGEVVNLTSVEIVRELARVKRVDSDGAVEWLSKDRIAAVAGLRAVEARAIIDEVRGVEKSPQPAPPQTPHAGRQYDPSKYREQAT